MPMPEGPGIEDMKIEEIPEETTSNVVLTTSSHDMTAEASLSFGDSCFVDEDFSQAVDAYAAAMLMLREDDPGSAALKIRILSHRSAAFYRLRNYQDALDDALEALDILGGNTGKNIAGLRAGESELLHKRVGVAFTNMQKFQQAKVQFEKAQQLATLNRGDEKAYKSYIKQCEYNLKPRQTAPSPMMDSTPDSSPAPAAGKEPSSAPKAAATKPTVVASKTTSTKAATNPKSQPTSTPRPSSSSSGEPSSTTSKKTPVSSMPKYQYYQDDKFMTIQILASNVKQEELDVRFEPKHLTVKLLRTGVNHTVICGNLYSEVDADNCKIKIKDEKVLIKLKKTDLNYEWPELLGKKTFPEPTPAAASETKTDDEGNEPEPAAPVADPVPKVEPTLPRPYASHRDWDKIEKQLADQEKDEKPEGDEAMNKLFQTIYASADEDTRRAMIKSYQTSGGTVLSTNWGEVKEKDYEKERSAPKGMEWKTWNGEKLPMKDDD